MRLAAGLVALATFSVCVFASAPELHQRDVVEPVFGIELSMENIRISFATPGEHAKSLATVKGGPLYEDLMTTYYVLCQWAYTSQDPPFSYNDYLGTKTTEHQSQMLLETDPDLHEWYTYILGQAEASQTLPELDAYHNDTDVAILATAVKDLRKAAVEALENQYNITMPHRPLVSIAAPSFMWTTVEPDTCEEAFDPHCTPQCDTYSNSWHHIFGLKISAAVSRAGFSQELINGSEGTMPDPDQANLKTTCPIAPAGYAAFWNPDFSVGAGEGANQPAADYRPQYEESPAVVVDLTNATLSLWAQQKCSFWSPWHTRSQYGAWQQFADDPGYMYHADEGDAWDQIVARIQLLREFLRYPYHETLDVYLTGDAWNADMVDAFSLYRANHEYTTMNVVLRDPFSASDGAATIAREMLDTYRLQS